MSAYFIIYVATIFLGNISAFAAFWLVAQGYFGAWGIPLLILVIFLADMTGDILWYTLGRTLHDTKPGNWIKKHLPGYKRAEAAIERNGKRLIFAAKFLYASSFPIIFLIGWTRKMDFRRFVKNSVYSILLWLPILLGIAYGIVSGLWPLKSVLVVKNFEWLFLVGLVLFLLLDLAMAKIFGTIFNRRNGNGRNGGKDPENNGGGDQDSSAKNWEKNEQT